MVRNEECCLRSCFLLFMHNIIDRLSECSDGALRMLAEGVEEYIKALLEKIEGVVAIKHLDKYVSSEVVNPFGANQILMLSLICSGTENRQHDDIRASVSSSIWSIDNITS